MPRDDRLINVEDPSVDDTRSEAQRDRDRILYSSAFRRLGGVTQVVSASEGLIIHNRLTHTLKVAQVARRLAERLLKKTDKALIDELGGLDPDVAEAAALAHDLGHPPFGHIAEEELQKLAGDAKCPGALEDSFEGNAQSFRIVARQSVRTFHYTGLNLTRATLNAILKYPWYRGEGTYEKRDMKWGAYVDEKESFEFARAEAKVPFARSLEAEIMDWADDIAYALHDTEDFYRAGLIPLDRLIAGRDQQEHDAFLSHYFSARKTDEMGREVASKDLSNAIGNLAPQDRFRGSMSQRSTLRSWVSNRIGKYISAFTVKGEPAAAIHIQPDAKREIDLLKQLTWYYVIRNPALATQQAGQRKIIRDLFTEFRAAATESRDEIFPMVFADRLRKIRAYVDDGLKERATTRLVVDLIASMTEDQALRIHHKLSGVAPGSVMDQFLHHSIG